MSGWTSEQPAQQPDQQPWDAVPPSYAYPQQQPGAPGYGYPQQQPYYPGYPVKKTNGLAITSMVCGICGFLYFIPAILGIVFGFIALRQIKRDGNDGRGMAITGITVGIVWLLLLAALILALVAAS